jgi:hypothetical protein
MHDWYLPAADELQRFLISEEASVNFTDDRYVNPEAIYFMWSPVQEPYDEENWVNRGGYDAVSSAVRAVCYMDVDDFHPRYVRLDDSWTLRGLCILDTAYGIMVQKAAQNKTRENGLDIPKVTVIGKAKCIEDAIRMSSYVDFMSEYGFDVAISNPVWLSLLQARSGVNIFEFRRLLNFLRPTANVDLVYEDAEERAFLKSPVNLDCGYAGLTGWYRLGRLLNRSPISNDNPDLFNELPDQFEAALSVLETLNSFMENVVTPDVHSNLQEVIDWNKLYI